MLKARSPFNLVSFIEQWASLNAPPPAVTATRDGEEIEHETQTSPVAYFSLHKVNPHSLFLDLSVWVLGFFFFLFLFSFVLFSQFLMWMFGWLDLFLNVEVQICFLWQIQTIVCLFSFLN